MKKKKESKPFFEGDFKCPWCKKPSKLKLTKKIITPSEPAVTEVEADFKKIMTLDEFEPKKKKRSNKYR